MELSSLFNSLFLADLSAFLELALLSLCFLYLSYVFVVDSNIDLEVGGGEHSLFSRPIKRRFSIPVSRTSPVVRGSSLSGISYRGRSLKRQLSSTKLGHKRSRIVA